MNTAGGALTEVTQSGPLNAGGLELLGTGSYELDNPSNDVAILVASTTGSTLRFSDSDGFDIGTVGATAGVSAGDSLILEADAAVTQSQAISAAGLGLRGAGPFELVHAGNMVATLAADTTDDIRFTNDTDLVIGTVGATSGLSTTGDVTLRVSGDTSQTVAVSADGLALVATDMSAHQFDLNDVDNDVDTFAASTASVVSFRDSDGFDIGTVDGILGVSDVTNLFPSSDAAVTQSSPVITHNLGFLGNGIFNLTNANNDFDVVQATGVSSVAQDISIRDVDGLNLWGPTPSDFRVAGDLTINTGGAVTQSAGIRLRASGLELLGTGPFTLTNTANDIDRLAASTSAEISLADVDGLEIGTVGGTAGVSTFSDLTIDSGGPVTQIRTIQAAGLALLGGGPYTLTDPGNDVDTLAANTGGGISFTDLDEVTIGTVGATSGIATFGNLTLKTGSGASQTQGLIALGLELLGVGPFELDNSGNDINIIAADVDGDIRFTDGDDLEIGIVGTTIGVMATGSVELVAMSLTGGSDVVADSLELTSLSGGILVPGLDLSGDLNVMTAGPVGQSGSLSIGGTSTFDAGASLIDLSKQSNDFQGPVSVFTTGDNGVVLADENGLILGMSSVGGDLHLSVLGPVSQSGPIAAVGVELFGAGPFTLDDAGNDVDILAASPYAGGVSFRDKDDLQIGTVGRLSGIDTPGDLSLRARSISVEHEIYADGSVELATSGAISLANDVTAGRVALNAGTSTLVTASSTLTADVLSLGGSVTGTEPLNLLTLTEGKSIDIGGSGDSFMPVANVAALSGFGGRLSVGGTALPDSARVSAGDISVSALLSVPGDLTLVSLGNLEVMSGGQLKSGGTLTIAALDQNGQGDILDPGPGEPPFYFDAPTLVLLANDEIGTAANPLTVRSGPNTVHLGAGSGVAYLDGDPGKILTESAYVLDNLYAFSALGLYVADVTPTYVVTPIGVVTPGGPVIAKPVYLPGSPVLAAGTNVILASLSASDYIIDIVDRLGMRETEHEKRKRQLECPTW